MNNPNKPQLSKKSVKTLRNLAIFRLLIGIILTIWPLFIFFRAMQQPIGFARSHAFFGIFLFFVTAALPIDILTMTIIGIWRSTLRKKYNPPKNKLLSPSTIGLLLCCFFWLPVCLCLFLAEIL